MNGNKQKTKVRLWTKNFNLLLIINLFIFVGFQMLLPTMSLYAEQLGADNSVIGLVLGFFVISAVILRPFSGIFLDTIGRRIAFIIGQVITVIAIAFYAWAPGIILLLIFRLIHGGGWSFSTTASNTIAAENLPRERFGEGMGYFNLTMGLGMALGPTLGLLLADGVGYKMMFLISAGLSIIALLMSFTLKYKKYEKPTEKLRLTKSSFYEKAALRPAALMIAPSLAYAPIISFLSIHAENLGVPNIGLFFTVYAIALLVSRPGFGMIIDRKGYKYGVIPGFICIIISTYILSIAASLPPMLIAAFIFGVGFGSLHMTLQTMAVVDVGPKRLGIASGTFMTAYDGGIGIGAIIFGFVAKFVSYNTIFLMSTIVAVLFFIYYFVSEAKIRKKAVNADNSQKQTKA